VTMLYRSSVEEPVTRYVLAIDQGTTSTRAILFHADTTIAAVASGNSRSIFQPTARSNTTPKTSGHRPSRPAKARCAAPARRPEISSPLESPISARRLCCGTAPTVRAVHRAIVWQDRRTADLCERLKTEGREPLFTAKTGLLLDPYFSGTKLAWLLKNIPGAAEAAARGELAFGTVDTYLLWRLTGGKVHATDATNASRTLLFNIHEGRWDDALLRCSAYQRVFCRQCSIRPPRSVRRS